MGIEGLPGFAHPPTPWLVYPLLGFALGSVASSYRTATRPRALLTVAAIGVAGLLPGMVALALSSRGLYRFGTMNSIYFIASLSCLSPCLVAAMLIRRMPMLAQLAGPLSIQGLRSFAIVPFLYAMLAACAEILGPPSDAARDSLSVAITFVVSAIGSLWFLGAVKAPPASAYRPVRRLSR